MQRRECLQCLSAACLGAPLTNTAWSAATPGPKLTPREEIEQRVSQARPLLGGPIPADLQRRLGAAHYGGKHQP